MTKEEYLVNLYHCHIKCNPPKNKCNSCPFFERYKKLYGNEEYDTGR